MGTTTNASADWVGSTRTKLLASWLPHAALVAGLLVVVPARMVIWIDALAWMGVACILNARGCGRTHCRFNGPHYLVMIIPVLALGLRVFPAGHSDGWSSAPSLSSAKRYGGRRSARGGSSPRLWISVSGAPSGYSQIDASEGASIALASLGATGSLMCLPRSMWLAPPRHLRQSKPRVSTFAA
jgi:hypothetical protein